MCAVWGNSVGDNSYQQPQETPTHDICSVLSPDHFPCNSNLKIVAFFFFLINLFTFREREREREREQVHTQWPRKGRDREGERESQADSSLSAQSLTWGLNSRTVRS